MRYTYSIHDSGRAYLAVALAAAFLLFLADPAAASTLSATLCTIAVTAQGTGAPIATLVVISLGISAMLGKITWGMALLVATGIAIVFGAQSIVALALANSGAYGTGAYLCR